eukprot:6365201-Alexandrium_andersonii.AAC.1
MVLGLGLLLPVSILAPQRACGATGPSKRVQPPGALQAAAMFGMICIWGLGSPVCRVGALGIAQCPMSVCPAVLARMHFHMYLLISCLARAAGHVPA